MFYAYVGIGQVINSVDNERISFEYAMSQTQKLGNVAGLKEPQLIFPYPGNTPLTRERIIIARKWAQFYGGLRPPGRIQKIISTARCSRPNTARQDVDAIDEGNKATLGRILPEFMAVDFKNVKNFPIPDRDVYGAARLHDADRADR